MNNVTLMGHIVRDIDMRQAGETQIARFTLAVNRRFKREGQPDADFIGCVAFGKIAEFVNKYFQKGSKIAITGRIQTGSYEKNGEKVYTTDVIVETAEFCESKKSNSGNTTANKSSEGFMDIPESAADEGLPFN